MLSHFLLELSCQHSWSCLCQYSHHVTPSCLILHCEEEKRVFGALTPVSCSDHLAEQRNKNLSRRCHRKAEAESINQTWYFMLKMTLAKSRIALGWQTPSIWKARSALQRCKAGSWCGARIPSDIVFTAQVCPSVIPGPAPQHQHHLGPCQKCKFSGPTPDRLNQNLKNGAQ